MNRAFYIISLVLSVVFIGIVGYYSEEVESARYSYLFSSYSIDPYSTSYFPPSFYEEYTQEAGLISLFFILLFITTELLGLIKVKTKTTRVMSIIGLVFGGLFLFWDVAVIASPGSLSFDEVAPGFAFYGLIVLAFSIVGLVQSVRFAKGKTQTSRTSNDLLDS